MQQPGEEDQQDLNRRVLSSSIGTLAVMAVVCTFAGTALLLVLVTRLFLNPPILLFFIFTIVLPVAALFIRKPPRRLILLVSASLGTAWGSIVIALPSIGLSGPSTSPAVLWLLTLPGLGLSTVGWGLRLAGMEREEWPPTWTLIIIAAVAAVILIVLPWPEPWLWSPGLGATLFWTETITFALAPWFLLLGAQRWRGRGSAVFAGVCAAGLASLTVIAFGYASAGFLFTGPPALFALGVMIYLVARRFLGGDQWVIVATLGASVVVFMLNVLVIGWALPRDDLHVGTPSGFGGPAIETYEPRSAADIRGNGKARIVTIERLSGGRVRILAIHSKSTNGLTMGNLELVGPDGRRYEETSSIGAEDVDSSQESLGFEAVRGGKVDKTKALPGHWTIIRDGHYIDLGAAD